VHSVEFVWAVVRVQQSGLAGAPAGECHYGWRGSPPLRLFRLELRSAPWERPIGYRPGAAVLARADEVVEEWCCMLRCICRFLCRFSDAGIDVRTTCSCGRRPKSAKARNRGK